MIRYDDPLFYIYSIIISISVDSGSHLATEVQIALRGGGGRGLRRHAAGELRRSRRPLGEFAMDAPRGQPP